MIKKMYRKYIGNLTVVLILGMLVLPMNAFASIPGDFTDNGTAGAVIVPASATNVLVMDVTIPDGTNGLAEDTLILDGGAIQYNGDTLFSFTGFDFFMDDNGDTNWQSGVEAIWIDTSNDGMIQAGEIQGWGTADLESFTVFDFGIDTDADGFYDGEATAPPTGEAVFLDANGDGVLGVADDATVGLPPGAMLRDGIANIINFDSWATANPGVCGIGAGGCHGEPNIDDIYFCDDPAAINPAIFDPGLEAIFTDDITSNVVGDYDPAGPGAIDVLISDPTGVVAGTGSCTGIPGGGTPIPLTAGLNLVVFIDTDGSGTYGQAGGAGFGPPPASIPQAEPIVYITALAADYAPLTALGNYGGFAPSTVDTAVAIPEWDTSAFNLLPMNTIHGGNLRYLGLTPGAGNDFYQVEAIVDDANANGILEAGEWLADDIGTRGPLDSLNFPAAYTYAGTPPFTSGENIYDDSVGGTPTFLDKQEDELNALTVYNSGTAVDTTDITNVQLWAENGATAGFQSAQDTNLGVMAWDGGDSWDLSGLTTPILAGGLRIYVTIDVAAAPPANSAIQMGISQLNDVGADGGYNAGDNGLYVASNNDGPVGGPFVNGATQIIDVTPPTGTATAGTATLYDGDLTQEVTIDYSEPMDGTSTPTISFGATIGVITSNADGVWFDADTWTETFDITDVNENTVGVTVSSSAATDLAGNAEGAPIADTFNVDTQNPTPTPANISIAGCTGTSGECVIGDTVIMEWDAGADGWTDVANVTPVDMSQFGGAAAQNAVDNGSQCGDTPGDNKWTACYTIMGGEGIDTTNQNAVVTATDNIGNVSAAVAGTNNMSVDTDAPVVTPPAIETDGILASPPFYTNSCTGTAGTCVAGDTITAVWYNGLPPGIDFNPDVNAPFPGAVNFDFIMYGGGIVAGVEDDGGITVDCPLTMAFGPPTPPGVPDPGVWCASYLIVPGTTDVLAGPWVDATDDAGNTSGPPILSIAPDMVDNQDPIIGPAGTVTLSNDINLDGFASIGDTITYTGGTDATGDTTTWTVDLSAYGFSATAAPGPYVIAANDDDGAFAATEIATDDAGNTDTGSVTLVGFTNIDNVNPVITVPGTVTLSNDVNGDGIASVGDTITYAGGTDGTGDAGTTWTVNLSAYGLSAVAAPGPHIIPVGIADMPFSATETATDEALNFDTGPATITGFTTIDNIDPTITAPSTFTISNDVNSNGIANIGDTVDYNADGTEGTGDTLALVPWTVDISGLTGNPGDIAVPAGSYVVGAGVLNGPSQFTETVHDDAENQDTGFTVAFNVYNIAPGVLTGTSVTPANTLINTATSYTVAFTTVNTLPSNGFVEVTFPAQFNIAGLNTNVATSLNNIDGTLTASVAGQVVTFTRGGGATNIAGGTAISFNIATGTNGPTAGLTGTFIIRTLNNALNLLDEDAAVPGVTLTAPPPPIPPSGGGGGRRATPPAEDTTETEVPLVFSDVAGHWAEDYIYEAKDSGYVTGYADETFKPDQYIERSEASKLIAMWLDANIGDDACVADLFSDVDCSAWYAKYVTYLHNAGIIEGYGDTTFGPGNYINRAEALKMMLFAKAIQDNDVADILNPFSDVSMDQWFYNYVMIGYNLSIIQGYEDGTFGPDKNITRAEFTKIFIETLINN